MICRSNKKEGQRFIAYVKKLHLQEKRFCRGERLIRILEKKGFKYLDSGVYKTAFKHKKFPHYVLKVYNTKLAFKDDSYYTPIEIKKFILEPIYKTKKLQVQHRVSLRRRMAAWNKIQKQYKKDLWDAFDVHDNNVGWLNGKPVIFDFCTKDSTL